MKVRKELTEDLPAIRGHADQLQQVLMNLMMNAQDAMEGHPGTVTVTTGRPHADRIEVRVIDRRFRGSCSSLSSPPSRRERERAWDWP